MDQSINLPATANQPENFFSLATFSDAHKVAGVLAKSKLIPANFQNNVPDCIIAMEMSQRIGASIFSVMQSLYIVHGRPTWSAQFIIASLNSCGRFSPLRFEIEGKGDDRVCYAWAIERGTNERLEGPPVSIQMAVREGWMGKNGSKWQTMPELMLRYRAATFFGRLYAPDILMGMRTQEELLDGDVGGVDEAPAATAVDDLNARFTGETIDAETGEVIEPEPQKQEEASPQGEGIKQPPATKERAPVGTAKETQTDATNGSSAQVAVKAFLKELNTKQTADQVDQWRAKHHNRVANACGGQESDGYLQVMDYAEVKYRDLLEAEKQEAKSAGGKKDPSLF